MLIGDEIEIIKGKKSRLIRKVTDFENNYHNSKWFDQTMISKSTLSKNLYQIRHNPCFWGDLFWPYRINAVFLTKFPAGNVLTARSPWVQPCDLSNLKKGILNSETNPWLVESRFEKVACLTCRNCHWLVLQQRTEAFLYSGRAEVGDRGGVYKITSIVECYKWPQLMYLYSLSWPPSWILFRWLTFRIKKMSKESLLIFFDSGHPPVPYTNMSLRRSNLI